MTEMSEEYALAAGATPVRVSLQRDGEHALLTLGLETAAQCRLHWGLTRGGGGWQSPPEVCWPPGTESVGDHAVQSPFTSASNSEQTLEIDLDLAGGWRALVFVLYFPENNRWIKDGRNDFQIPLPRPGGQASAKEALAAVTTEGDWQRQEVDLGQGDRLVAATLDTGDAIRAVLACDMDLPLVLHWGIAERFHHEWRLPTPEMRPPGSEAFDTRAVRTPFEVRDGVQWIEMRFERPEGDKGLRGMDFILYQPDGNRWIKDSGRDMHLPLFEPAYADSAALESPSQKRLVNEILGAELGKNSWTLMHRFNLCHDLLDGLEQDQDALALLYTWLRFSAIRQLDWQRNYNTQPRELAHSQDRLTLRLTDIYRDQPQSRTWVALMLGTLGRGGNRGQQVRDEILNIMHRHHIKEVGGHFMEEWHQKLHNNTTPDDVVICEGYLAFLHSDGDLDRFYGVLSDAGVSRERLRNFDRPIVTDPDFISDKKHGLLEDFQNYLRVLNAVHSGTDLETAVAAARDALDDRLNGKLNALFAEGAKPPPDWVRPKDLHKQRGTATTPSWPISGAQAASRLERAKVITDVRRDLRERIAATGETAALRSLIYLDLALAEAMRSAIEGQDLAHTSDEELFALTDLALEGLRLSTATDELGLCADHFAQLVTRQTDDPDWALRLKGVTDRLIRAVAEWTSGLYDRVQPKAELLGGSFEAEDWTIELFGEEVIRGGPAFTLSRLMRRVDPMLRARAGIGGWQVLSPAGASGQVLVIDSLMSVQGETYGKATVLVTDRVTGEEEIPDGVTAVLTSDTPDLVAHVAVRARNEQVLFATCFDEETFQDLKSHEGRSLVLSLGTGGEVEYVEGEADAPGDAAPPKAGALGIRRRAFSRWAVGAEAFDNEIVGGKSNNLNALRGRLSDWVRFPTPLALPFGAFEQALATPENEPTARKLEDLLAKVAADPATRLIPVRKAIGELVAPEPLREALLGEWERAGLPAVAWDQTWRAITRVWASKWNDRAYFSRTARGISHDDLMMAVLIQQVVKADYAFVIHTVNPINGDTGEIYAELVLGMGETLVGNYPGRAMSFVAKKDGGDPTLTAYPSKSVGLYGSGVIFRSDSNGEDLEGFAGAGLYDSFLAEKPRMRLLDYTGEPLLDDQGFARDMLAKIARIGIEVEQACGSPQDIEGAVQGGDYYVVQTRPQVGL